MVELRFRVQCVRYDQNSQKFQAPKIDVSSSLGSISITNTSLQPTLNEFQSQVSSQALDAAKIGAVLRLFGLNLPLDQPQGNLEASLQLASTPTFTRIDGHISLDRFRAQLYEIPLTDCKGKIKLHGDVTALELAFDGVKSGVGSSRSKIFD